jgi:hypothetical protein
MNKINKEHVEAVREFWYSYGKAIADFEATEVVEILDYKGTRSILIKERKKR